MLHVFQFVDPVAAEQIQCQAGTGVAIGVSWHAGPMQMRFRSRPGIEYKAGGVQRPGFRSGRRTLPQARSPSTTLKPCNPVRRVVNKHPRGCGASIIVIRRRLDLCDFLALTLSFLRRRRDRLQHNLRSSRGNLGNFNIATATQTAVPTVHQVSQNKHTPSNGSHPRNNAASE